MKHFQAMYCLSLFRNVVAATILLCVSTMANAEPLLVSAAASLTGALREFTGTDKAADLGEITYNFGGSGTLQKQIENGAPVDVFISAAAPPMDALEKQGLLLADSRTNLLTNTLVLITQKERQDLRTFADLAHDGVKHIAIGEPKTVPAGVYASECLTFQGLLPKLDSKLVRLLNVRQVLAAVETGNADAGLVYQTDSASSQKVRTVAVAPVGSHQPITYPIAIVRRSKQIDAARKYIELLKSPTARAIFEKHGFGVVP